MKTTRNIIHKETGKKINEDDIKSLRINNTIIHNQVSTANEFNYYFLNIGRKITNKIINNKKEAARPLKNLFKCFNQPFKDSFTL
jgi:hypothetical protein